MRSAECGMRTCSGSSVGARHSSRHSAFRIPHSALGGEGRGGEDRRRVRHAAPRLGGRRLQEGGRREGRGSGVRRGPGPAGPGTRRPDGRRRRPAGAGARAAGDVPAEARVQRVRVVPRARPARIRPCHGAEMHGYRYTGSSPTGLLVARNKSLTKKILAYHGIRVPAFAEFHPGEKPLRPSELRFPLIVKPLLEDASIGIAQASVVEDDGSLADRVKFIHEKFNQAAIVEELIEGRELYVGLLGNDKLQVLPIVEMTFGEAEAAEQRIATYKAKWDEEYRKRKRIKNVFAKGLADELTAKIGDLCATAFHALWLQDYGRVDLRLTHDDEVYVLEVNPNPFLAFEHEMANAAEKAGLSYDEFIQRIVDEAMKRDQVR